MTPAIVSLVAFALISGATFAAVETRARRQRFQQRLAQAMRPASPLLTQKAPAVPAETSPESLLSRLQRRAGRDARRHRFDAQIPDMLLLMVSALRAGHSPARAIQMVAEEMPAPACEEFAVALSEIGLGLTVAAALARMSERVCSVDWDLVVTAVTTQVQTGGNLAEMLTHIADTVRERVRVQGEITTLTAEGRISALILVLLPPVLALALLLRNPHYFQPLLGSPLGHTLIAGAVAGQVAGTLLLRRMLSLDL